MEGYKRDEDRLKLLDQITEWNANRLDLFEISPPNEDLEFFGVMRFFYQDEVAKVITKCVRVSSTANTRDVLDTLIEKFRPDMRMLTLPDYALYEVHVNGEERRLNDEVYPLLVQLNWGKDDREGRFLLKRIDDKQIRHADLYEQEDEMKKFNRKTSKRDKKEKKKKEKQEKLKGKENIDSPGKHSVAEEIYIDLPETSFTRTISNPEVVMKRRRQQKLEKKLEQIKTQGGGPDSGGTLKIYGESLQPDVPYKTLLLSTADTCAFVVKETLQKYGLEREDPKEYCLVQVQSGGDYHNNREEILHDMECPLAILQTPFKGSVTFHIRKRSDVKKKKRPKSGMHDESGFSHDSQVPDDKLPYLLELSPDGTELKQGKRHYLSLNVTEIGSISTSGQHLQLFGPTIQPHHCVIAHTEGIVTVTPTSKDSETYVDGQRVLETTILQHGKIVRFGRHHAFRFCDPLMEQKQQRSPREGPMPQRAGPYGDHKQGYGYDDGSRHPEPMLPSGHGPRHEEHQKRPVDFPMRGFEELLPASLEFRDEGEDAFLAAIITEVNGAAVQFKLSPTYTLYMAVRYRIKRNMRPDIGASERAHRLSSLVNKIAGMVQQTIRENRDNAGALAFWMANASELLHFFKQDHDICPYSIDAQDILAEAIQIAFGDLVQCMQGDLYRAMPAFFNERDDEDEAGDVIHTLSSAMSLLRRCRVNAALTIQLFSQLFHFVNMWLFNKLVLEPRAQLCTQAWGSRLKKHLGRIEAWAEKQGLELAADCHLCRIIQAAHLLQAPKSSPDDIASISSTCFKLNSVQLRALLQNYIPAPDEQRIPQDLIESVVSVAENTADELTRSEGRDIRLEEDPDLNLPFLLPEDGYSCDIVKGVPNGLPEFLEPLSQTGICRLTIGASQLWTVYMQEHEQTDSQEGGYGNVPGHPGDAGIPPGLPRDPEIMTVQFNKVHGSMGLSIVAAKGEHQKDRGIYVKSVVPGGAAALDGRLQAGDQLLEVDGKNLVGLTQEKAAELMTRTGDTVTLKVAKQGAIYHGLATLLSQPSPEMQRADNRRQQGPGSANKSRPKSEDVSRFNGPKDNSPMREYPPAYHRGPGPMEKGRPLNQGPDSRSSPALHNQQQERPGDREGFPPSGGQYRGQEPINDRSKSTSNLKEEQMERSMGQPRQAMSSSTLPRSYQQRPHDYVNRPGPQEQQREYLNRSGPQDIRDPRDPRNQPTYQNYPPPDNRYGNAPPHMRPQHPDTGRASPYQQAQQLHDTAPVRQEPAQREQVQMRHGSSASRPRSSHEMAHQDRHESGQGRPKSEYHNRMGRHPSQTDTRYEQRPPQSPYGREGDIPRSEANNQQYQQNFYQNAPIRSREATPPFEQMQRPPHDEKAKPPSTAPKPNVMPKPDKNRIPPQEIPKEDVDPRRSQRNFFEPERQEVPRSPYQAGTYPISQRHPDEHYRQDRPTPPRQEHLYGNRLTESLDLPPPPPDLAPELPPPPPPPQETVQPEDLPPPPPPVHDYVNYDPQGRVVPEHLKQQEGWRRGPPQQQYPAYSVEQRQDGYNEQKTVYSFQQQFSEQPGPQPQEPYRPQNRYESQRGPGDWQGQDQSRYPGQGQAAPTSQQITVNTSFTSDTAGSDKQLSPSPWVKEEQERQARSQEDGVKLRRDQMIADLQSKPYLTPDEQEKLRKLRLDQEFQRRVEEVSSRDDENDDSDTELQNRAQAVFNQGREALIRMMSEEHEKGKQRIAESEQKRKQEEEIAERELALKQDRILQQLEQQRNEERMRTQMRQEKKQREHEEWLRKQRANGARPEEQQQRTLTRLPSTEKERLRQRLEEQLRSPHRSHSPSPTPDRVKQQPQQLHSPHQTQPLSPNPDRYRQTQELREKQRREQEDNRRMQMMEEEKLRQKREEEVRRKREQERQQLHEMEAARDAEERAIREQLRRQEEESRQQYQYHTYQNIDNKGSVAPPPPERKSSYDLLNQHGGYRPPSSSREEQSKKSVSFNSKDDNNHSGYNSLPPNNSTQGHPPPFSYMSNNSMPSEPRYSSSNYPASSAAPITPKTPVEVLDSASPQQVSVQYTNTSTPGVIGAQEVYRDPRARIAAQRQTQRQMSAEGEKLSFRDKMKKFAQEAGENTPKERPKSSSMQRAIESSLNGQ